METPNIEGGLRVVTFHVMPFAYAMLRRWAEETGNRIVLVVTTPGPTSRRTPSYIEVIAQAPPETDVLVTTRLRRVAAPLIRALAPDLLISFTFPYRIPPEVRTLARYGAVNLHPTPLPAYRGPNVARPFYEGWPEMGATLHWTEDEYDDGRILSQHTAPLPATVTRDTVLPLWLNLTARALADGVQEAVAGAVGTAQDHTKASYAAAFTEAEHWLDWTEPGATLQRRTFALAFGAAPSAKSRIGGRDYLIAQITPACDIPTDAAPGTLLDDRGNVFIIAAGDGAVRVSASPLPEA